MTEESLDAAAVLDALGRAHAPTIWNACDEWLSPYQLIHSTPAPQASTYRACEALSAAGLLESREGRAGHRDSYETNQYRRAHDRLTIEAGDTLRVVGVAPVRLERTDE